MGGVEGGGEGVAFLGGLRGVGGRGGRGVPAFDSAENTRY